MLVSARRFRDLQVSDDELAAPQPLVEVTRPLTAPELVADDEPADVIEGPAGRERWTRRTAVTTSSSIACSRDGRGD